MTTIGGVYPCPPVVSLKEVKRTMKTLGLVLATLALMTAFTPSGIAPAVSEKNSSTVCITYVNAGLGCATGTIGSLAPTGCNTTGCTVTLTADLLVTPVACGWLEQGDLSKCAIEKPESRHGEESPFFAPGTYTIKSDLCVTDPTVSYTFPCDELSHTFVVPTTNANQAAFTDLTQAVQDTINDLPNGGGLPGDGKLVYVSGTFRVYQMVAFE